MTEHNTDDVLRVSGKHLGESEPVTKPVGGCAGAVTTDGFELGFSAVIQQVPRDPDKVKKLLREARMMHDLPAPPAGRDGCKNCLLLERMLKVMGKGQRGHARRR